MVLPVLAGIGLGTMALGTGAQLYGAHQRDEATRNALKGYREAADARFEQERRALQEQSDAYYGLAGERQAGVGSYLSGLGMARRPADPSGFQAEQQGALRGIGQQTAGMGGSGYAYSGAPQQQSQAQQAGITGDQNAKHAAAMLADWQKRQTTERETAAQHRMSLGDILRQSKGASMEKRMQLAKALRDLDWQRQQMALQGTLDAAQRKGQWLSTLGGLGTQLGGMATTAGLAMGGGAAGAGAAGAGAAGAGAGAPMPPPDATMPGYLSLYGM